MIMNDKCDSERFVADVMRKVPPSGIRKYFDLASGIGGVISLGVGEPDFVTPWHIREACIHSLESGKTSYTSNFGLMELREEIAKLYSHEHGVQYDPISEILIMSGVSEALDVAIRAITNPGDEIIVPQPAYVAYIPSVMFAGGVPVPVVTHPDNNFKLTAEDLKRVITPRTKALIINYPNNPTGTIMDRKDLEAIAKVVSEHDIIVISDEVYECLTYNGKHTCFSSIEGMKDRTILLNGFSKAYAMTGFRLAYALAPSPVVDAMMRIHQYCMLCAPITAQIGAIEALRNGNEEMQRMKRDYDRRRHLIVSGLNRIGLKCYEPKGAFYAFPSVKGTGLTSEKFAERLLREQKVVTIPGDVFGPAGEGFLRCSYATSKDQIIEALNRMEMFMRSL